VGCELVSHHLDALGDTYKTTVPRFFFGTLEKLAIQGTAGLLGAFLAKYFRKVQGHLELFLGFFLLVILGTVVFISVNV
jgi:putative Mn2+ efflux pump MntP